MKKKVIIGVVIALIVIAIILGVVFMVSKTPKTNLPQIEKAED